MLNRVNSNIKYRRHVYFKYFFLCINVTSLTYTKTFKARERKVEEKQIEDREKKERKEKRESAKDKERRGGR